MILFLAILISSSVAAGQTTDALTSSLKDTVSARDSLTASRDSLTGLHGAAILKDTVSTRKDTLDIIVSTEGLNTIPGFRVQIGSTQNLSEAMDRRAKAENLLADYNIYLIYDSPYYKVRAGDFKGRYDASQAANFISGHGFPGAWVVPDNVFKNPIRKSR